MDKIDFARLIAVISSIVERPLAYDEIRDLDSVVSLMPYGKANPATVNALIGHVKRGDSKIEAIREYRALTGCTLKDSKDAIEAHWPALSEHAA